MWIKQDFFKYCVGTILILIIIILFGQIGFFIAPFVQFAALLFFPLLISAAFYYLFRPMVKLLKKAKIPATLAIIIVFVFVIVVFSFVATYAGTIIITQFQQFVGDLPKLIDIAKDKATQLKGNQNLVALYSNQIESRLGAFLQQIIPSVSSGLIGAISTITNIASILVIVPFILFYVLKEDITFYQRIKRFFPTAYDKEIAHIIRETDKTLSTYIIGQAMIAFILGLLTFSGYLIIGLDYAFILGFFVCITSFIPIFGVIIGVLPALLVALPGGPSMLLKVAIICIIVQQIEGNFISPFIIGKRLDMHPLTIIIIFMGAASQFGFIGMLIAIPAYAVLKVIFIGTRKIFQIWKSSRQSNIV